MATQMYPSPTAFRFETLSTFDFTAEANAPQRAKQLARTRAEEEAVLQLNPTAPRWLTTPGVDIEETKTGWRFTINDLPPEPLRPAELELPFPDGWTFPPDAALSLKYCLIFPTSPSAGRSDESADLSAEALAKEEAATAPNRYEELEINLRDANGTLWGVWPRLSARKVWQSYLEQLSNFPPMFYSRPPTRIRHGGSLVIFLRPRTIPTTIEIQLPRLVRLVPKDA